MPAKTNDSNLFGESDLNQELIDQMLNGGSADQTADPWADDTLQAEIEAARTAAGGMLDSGARTATAERAPPAPTNGPAPTAVHPLQFIPLTPQIPLFDQGHRV